LVQRYADDHTIIHQTKIFLPSKRACGALQKIFSEMGGVHVVPQLIPLGDVEDDAQGAMAEGYPDFFWQNIPDAISPMKRQLVLATLIQQWSKTNDSYIRNFEESINLASELMQLLDQFQSESIPYTKLIDLIPEEFASHWEVTLEFLKIIFNYWPKILADDNMLDPIERRNLWFKALISYWQDNPPDSPVIVAGSTGTFPQTANLMKFVTNLPLGLIVLPGLDLACDDSLWQNIENSPCHPQYSLAQLLRNNDWERAQFGHWCEDKIKPRVAFFACAFVPAEHIDQWQHLSEISLQDTRHISRIDCATLKEEAEVISLILKETLEHKGKTAALVTPSRDLAERVKHNLASWNIAIDDSGGTPLDKTPAACFLALLLDVFESDFSAISLLSFFKHPFHTDSAMVEHLESNYLRDIISFKGLAGLINKARQRDDLHFVAWLEGIQDKFSPLQSAIMQKNLEIFIKAHLATVQNFVGENALWQNQESQSLHQFFENFYDISQDAAALSFREYILLFRHFISQRTYRPAQNSDCRLFIWGTIETRMIHADRMILAGLNEDAWPPKIKEDAWLNSSMRYRLELPPLERRVGLSAHDFIGATMADEVFLTRAEKINGAAQKPSRFLLRCDALLAQQGQGNLWDNGQQWRDWATELFKPAESISLKAPAPNPPATMRPKRYSASDIELLMRNPYGFYAKKVLKLKPLDAIDRSITNADIGIKTHDVLEKFMLQFGSNWPDFPLRELVKIGRAVFKEYTYFVEFDSMIWPRFMRCAEWFIEQERKRNHTVQQSYIEQKAVWQHDDFVLEARADRIDQLNTGAVVIIDYKTGGVPTRKDMLLGFSPQLYVEAVLLREGAFGDELSTTLESLRYWRMTGTESGLEEIIFSKELWENITAAKAGIIKLITTFLDENTPYYAVPNPSKAPSFDSYQHLSRSQEWGEFK
jgi:ATP-dependent helicase/nuclease subunit B